MKEKHTKINSNTPKHTHTHTQRETYVHTQWASVCDSGKNWGHLFKLPKYWLSLGHMPRRRFPIFYSFLLHFVFRVRVTQWKAKRRPTRSQRKAFADGEVGVAVAVAVAVAADLPKVQPICAVYLQLRLRYFSFPYLLRVHTDKHAHRHTHIHTRARKEMHKKTKNACTALLC